MSRQVTINDIDLSFPKTELYQYLPSLNIKSVGIIVFGLDLNTRYGLGYVNFQVVDFKKELPDKFVVYTGQLDEELFPHGIGKLKYHNIEISGNFFHGILNDSRTKVMNKGKINIYFSMFNKFIF